VVKLEVQLQMQRQTFVLLTPGNLSF